MYQHGSMADFLFGLLRRQPSEKSRVLADPEFAGHPATAVALRTVTNEIDASFDPARPQKRQRPDQDIKPFWTADATNGNDPSRRTPVRIKSVIGKIEAEMMNRDLVRDFAIKAW